MTDFYKSAYSFLYSDSPLVFPIPVKFNVANHIYLVFCQYESKISPPLHPDLPPRASATTFHCFRASATTFQLLATEGVVCSVYLT